MRLNRYLSASGFSSRRKGEEIIRSGRVTVNGVVATDPATSVKPGVDTVAADGREITVEREKRSYVMNKPTGVIVSRGDTHGRTTVYELLGGEAPGVFTVGRLDFDTSGVLLFTDDGELAHRLTHPSFGVDKTYRVGAKGRIGDDAVRRLAGGVRLDDGVTAPAKVVVIETGDTGSLVEITIHEGRKRQVRRMFDAVGHPVRTLERISFGGVTAEGLPPGGYRPLGADEVERLREAVGLKQKERGR